MAKGEEVISLSLWLWVYIPYYYYKDVFVFDNRKKHWRNRTVSPFLCLHNLVHYHLNWVTLVFPRCKSLHPSISKSQGPVIMTFFFF